jgi:hypothetical protein
MNVKHYHRKLSFVQMVYLMILSSISLLAYLPPAANSINGFATDSTTRMGFIILFQVVVNTRKQLDFPMYTLPLPPLT